MNTLISRFYDKSSCAKGTIKSDTLKVRLTSALKGMRLCGLFFDQFNRNGNITHDKPFCLVIALTSKQRTPGMMEEWMRNHCRSNCSKKPFWQLKFPTQNITCTFTTCRVPSKWREDLQPLEGRRNQWWFENNQWLTFCHKIWTVMTYNKQCWMFENSD